MTVLEMGGAAPQASRSARGAAARRVVSVAMFTAGALLFGANAVAIWGTGLDLLGWQSFL